MAWTDSISVIYGDLLSSTELGQMYNNAEYLKEAMCKSNYWNTLAVNTTATTPASHFNLLNDNIKLLDYTYATLVTAKSTSTTTGGANQLVDTSVDFTGTTSGSLLYINSVYANVVFIVNSVVDANTLTFSAIDNAATTEYSGQSLDYFILDIPSLSKWATISSATNAGSIAYNVTQNTNGFYRRILKVYYNFTEVASNEFCSFGIGDFEKTLTLPVCPASFSIYHMVTQDDTVSFIDSSTALILGISILEEPIFDLNL